jgi:hypothetical protein
MARVVASTILMLLLPALTACASGQYLPPLVEEKSSLYEIRSTKLVSSCGMDESSRLSAAESVMELVVSESLDPVTGKLKMDLDHRLFEAGQLLLVFIDHRDQVECRIAALEIKKTLISYSSS